MTNSPGQVKKNPTDMVLGSLAYKSTVETLYDNYSIQQIYNIGFQTTSHD